MTATSRRRAGVTLIIGTHADAVSSAMTRQREEAARTNQPGTVGGQRYKMEEQVLAHFVNVWGGGVGGGEGWGGTHINTEKTREVAVMAAWSGTARASDPSEKRGEADKMASPMILTARGHLQASTSNFDPLTDRSWELGGWDSSLFFPFTLSSSDLGQHGGAVADWE